MIVVVTGGRNHQLTLKECVWLVRTLDKLGCTVFRHGDCSGVDRDAADIAKAMGIHVESWPAKLFGEWPACGPKRNRAMLEGPEGRPQAGALLALPGNYGTRNCIGHARKWLIPIFHSHGEVEDHIPF